MPTLETLFTPAMPQWASVHGQLVVALRALGGAARGVRHCCVVINRDGPSMNDRPYQVELSLFGTAQNSGLPLQIQAHAAHRDLQLALRESFSALLRQLATHGESCLTVEQILPRPSRAALMGPGSAAASGA